jgi:hypothetical protein
MAPHRAGQRTDTGSTHIKDAVIRGCYNATTWKGGAIVTALI